jgi:hypothetical protein
MGTEIPGIQLHESQATEEALGAESGGAIQGASSGTYASDTGDKSRPDGPGLSGVSPRMDRLFREMRNPERARGTGAMAPTSTSVDGLETVETRNYKISRAPQARHRCAGSRANRRQLRWTVAPRKHSSAKTRTAERLLRLARASRAHRSWLVQPAEPPDADPHVRSCGRGGRATVSPIPIVP